MEEYFFTCPYCWQRISFLIDCSVAVQTYIEDCEVCCQPIEASITSEGGRVIDFQAEQS